MAPKPYDTTVARIAGNILGHLATQTAGQINTFGRISTDDVAVAVAVRLARAIVAETIRTEPEKASEPR